MTIEEIADSLQTKNYTKQRGQEQYQRIKQMRNKVLQESFLYGQRKQETEKAATIGGVDYAMWINEIGMNSLWYYLSKATKRHIVLIDKSDINKAQINALREEIDRNIKQVVTINGENFRDILQIAKSIATKGDVVLYVGDNDDKRAEYRQEVLRL